MQLLLRLFLIKKRKSVLLNRCQDVLSKVSARPAIAKVDITFVDGCRSSQGPELVEIHEAHLGLGAQRP
jgi:hypothetical protein